MKRIISLLVLSSALIVILITVGDLGEIIDETTKQQNANDWGIIKNCNPSKAICSIRSKYGDRSIKLSISTDQHIKALTPFEINLSIDGLNNNEIKQATITFNMPEMDRGENSQFFKISKITADTSSEWLTTASLSMGQSARSDWLATIELTLAENKKIRIGIPFTAHKN